MFSRHNKSFTLIELMVVISIIGFLSTIVLVNISSVRAKARDAKRLQDMRQILTAIMLFYDKYGDFPNNLSPGQFGYVAGYGPAKPVASYNEGETTCVLFDSSTRDWNSNGKPFLEPLQDFSFMGKVPTDPLGVTPATTCSGYLRGGYRYRYYRPTGGVYCGVNVGSIFWLAISDLETKTTKVPGCRIGSCTLFNNLFEWFVCGTQTGR